MHFIDFALCACASVPNVASGFHLENVFESMSRPYGEKVCKYIENLGPRFINVFRCFQLLEKTIGGRWEAQVELLDRLWTAKVASWRALGLQVGSFGTLRVSKLRSSRP